MQRDRKRVILRGGNEAFNHSLAALLAEMDVQLGNHHDIDHADVVIWHLGDQTTAEGLDSQASSSPTLVVADRSQLFEMVDLGVRGFLPTGTPFSEIRDAVETIIEGGSVVPPELLGDLLRHIVLQRRQAATASEQIEGLTERERQVFHLAAAGARKEEIGERLYISSATARTHLQRVYRKLGVHSQAELIALKVAMGQTEEDRDS